VSDALQNMMLQHAKIDTFINTTSHGGLPLILVLLSLATNLNAT